MGKSHALSAMKRCSRTGSIVRMMGQKWDNEALRLLRRFAPRNDKEKVTRNDEQ